jgi:alpha-L-rhamnosidase
MNSFNHYWLGCVSEWLITQAAGIDTAAPGFKQIRIMPVIVSPGTGFDWVKASYDSIRGKVSSSWKRDGERFELNVTVPGNTTATIFVPAKTGSVVKECGQSAREAKGVKFLREEGGRAVFEVGSGEYRFQSAL